MDTPNACLFPMNQLIKFSFIEKRTSCLTQMQTRSTVTVGYSSGSQPVVRGLPVVRGHLPGGPRAKATFLYC